MTPLAFIQYLIKEYFIYVMALYTLIFVLATILFVKYRANRRRVQANPENQPVVKSSRKMHISISGNRILFNESRNLNPNISEILKNMQKTGEIFIVTQVKNDQEESEIKNLILNDINLKNIIKPHVFFRHLSLKFRD